MRQTLVAEIRPSRTILWKSIVDGYSSHPTPICATQWQMPTMRHNDVKDSRLIASMGLGDHSRNQHSKKNKASSPQLSRLEWLFH
jgi:hypothetical protein